MFARSVKGIEIWTAVYRQETNWVKQPQSLVQCVIVEKPTPGLVCSKLAFCLHSYVQMKTEQLSSETANFEEQEAGLCLLYTSDAADE